MVTAKLTSKGQLTIPKAVRDTLRLHGGDRVAFTVHGDAEAVMKPMTKSVDEVFGLLYTPGQPRKNIEQMNDAIAERMRRQKQ